MMFSATSFAEAASSAGSEVSGMVPLMGDSRTVEPSRTRNSSGLRLATTMSRPSASIPARNAARTGPCLTTRRAHHPAAAITVGFGVVPDTVEGNGVAASGAELVRAVVDVEGAGSTVPWNRVDRHAW